MCNLYSLLNSIDELKHAFDVDEANANLGNAEPLAYGPNLLLIPLLDAAARLP